MPSKKSTTEKTVKKAVPKKTPVKKVATKKVVKKTTTDVKKESAKKKPVKTKLKDKKIIKDVLPAKKVEDVIVDLTKIPEKSKAVKLNIEKVSPTAIDSNMSRKELAAERKKIASDIKRRIENEKKDLADEFNKINVELAKAKKNLKISSAKEKAAKIEADKKLKIEKTQYLIDLKNIKERELEWNRTIKVKKKVILVKNKEHSEKTRLSIKELKINAINKRSELATQKQKLKEEMIVFMAEQKKKIAEKAIENANVLQSLKQEQKEEKIKLKETRANFKNELMNKKIELQNEVNAYKKSKEFELQGAREEKISAITNAKRKTSEIEKERDYIKQELLVAKLSSRAKIAEIKNETKKGIADIDTNNKVLALQAEAEIQEVIEKDKYEKLEKQKEIQEKENAVSINEYVEKEDQFDRPTGDTESTLETTQIIETNVEEETEVKNKIKIEAAENKISSYLGKWIQIEKRGTKIYSKIKGLTTNKEAKSFNKIDYFSTMIKNYEAANKSHAFVNFETIIKQSFVLANKPMKDVDIKRVYEIYVKAILTRVQVEFGNYFIIPKHIKGKSAFVGVKILPSGAKVFSLSALIGEEVNNSLKEIIDYKLNIGSSIRIVDGLALEAIDGNLQIVMMPNVLRR